MNKLLFLRKLPVLTFCLFIAQQTFAESPYKFKDIIYPVTANPGFENLSITAEPIEPPTSVSASSASICSGNSVSLEATCSSGTVIWYNVETGGTSIGSGSPLSQEPTVSTTYYAACLVDIGPARVTENESARVSTGQVTVGSAPASPTSISANPASVLSGVKVTLSAICSGGSVVWYNQLSGGAALGMGSSMPYYPKATVTYYASCKSGNCESTRVPANTVNVTAMNLLPYLVNDVFLAPDMYGESEDYPSPNSCNVNGILYFRGKNTASGQELWKSDGTEAGTVLIKDINPGTGSSEPENFLIINGVVFFTANDGVSGVELWKTDGTPDGTEMVKNINPSGDSYPSSFINFNDTLYFSARNNPNNAELWKSDGTPDGTVQVKDINTNGGSYPSSFVNHKGTLYFSATDVTDGANNYELWKTDGTEAGTVIVKDINPTGSANVGKLKSIGDILYFYGSSLSNDYELWQTDGTAENISRVKDINPVSGPSSIVYLTNLNGILLFTAYDGYGHELWRSNGTEDSTLMVKDIRPGNNGSGPSYLTNINGTVFFAANDANDNSELWKTDGTADGTVRVKEINPGGASYPMNFINLDGTLYFAASNVNYNYELWKSDGTESGTVLVKDMNSAGSSFPQEFINVNGKLYFGASGKKNIVYYDKELWSLGTCTDANSIVSKTGKSPHYNSQTQPASDALTCHCSIYNELISTVNATGANPVSGAIDVKEWVEETTPTTYLRRHYEINPASGDTTTTGKVTLYFTQADFDAYNTAAGSNAHKLPVNSSDASGITRILIERRTGTGNAETGLPDTYTKGIQTINPHDVDIVWNSTASRWEVSFSNTGFGGFFLKSETIADPTAVAVSTTTVCAGSNVSLTATCEAGTVVWYNQATGGSAIGTSSPLQVSLSTSTTYYAACESGETSSGRVATNAVSIISLPAIPTAISVNKTAIFSGVPVSLSATCSSGNVIWYNQPSGGAAIGMGSGIVYYPASTAPYYATCKSGNCESSRVATPAVTVTAMEQLPYLVKDITVGSTGSSTFGFVNLNGFVYFMATDGINGLELWKSDGTLEGTKMVKDINPNAGNSAPSNLTVGKGTLYFTADDGTHGIELWKSDGTPEGTVMIKDIKEGITTTNPAVLTMVNDVLFFAADDGVHGGELWKSDGTPEGTVLVKDINPTTFSSVFYLLNVNGVLFFRADDGTHNNELWKSDGTTDGTVLVKDINPLYGSLPSYLTNSNGTLYFAANEPVNGYELWKSDGTAEGTVMVKNINLNDSSSPSNLTDVNGTVYFQANDNINGTELWKSNGTAEGTVLVKNIHPSSSSSPTNLANVNSTLYFSASDGVNGRELWKTDGTADGTVMVKDINISSSANPGHLTNFNGTLYFAANDGINGGEVWKTDGTTNGTVMIKDINEAGWSSPSYFTNVNGKLYFQATATINSFNYGAELWSLGTCTAANIIVSNFNKTLYYNSQAQPVSDTVTCYCSVFNQLISTVKARGLNPVSGNVDVKEWIEETAPTTYLRRHYEINPTSGDTTTTGKITLYFTQADFDAYNAAVGSNAYKLPVNSSDASGITRILIERRTGTGNAETGLPDTYTKGIQTINPHDVDIVWNSTASRWEVSFSNTGFGGFFLKSETIADPTAVTVSTTTVCAGSNVSLTATCAAGTVAWYSQATGGSAIGTSSPLQVSISTSTAYYAACETGETSSNRVATNTVNVNAIPAIPTGVAADKTAIISGATIILNATCSTGFVVWYTQQTGGSSIGAGLPFRYYPSTTTTFYASCKAGSCESSRVATSQVTVTSMAQVPYMVKDIQVGSNAGQTDRLTDVNGIVFFESGDDEGHGKELWKTDGTAAGTMMVKDINEGSGDAQIYFLINVNGTLFFRGLHNTKGFQLWKSDGTSAGTKIVKEMQFRGGSATIDNLINVNGTLYFTADISDSGVELWKSDGSESGTQLVKDINPGSANAYPSNLINVDGILYFIADDGTNEKELWRTDGTEAGTVRMTNLGDFQFPMELVYFNGSVIYSVRTQNTFRASLWKSSGIPGGEDIKLNTTDQVEIYKLTAANDVLYFVSDDFVYGNELWKTDGTVEGTGLIKDIRTDINNISSSPQSLTNVNGTLFFTAVDNTYSRKLWKSNGTEASTTIIKNIRPGNGMSGSDNLLTNVNGIAYFQANDESGDNELWQSDGTEAGTFRTKDLRPDYSSSPNNLVNANGKLFFRAGTILNGVALGYEPLALGTCTIANTLFSSNGKTVNYNSQQQVSPATTSCHCDIFNNLISTIDSIGANPVSGAIITKAWIEETAPEGYVRRHYEINPVSGDTTVTGKVTLYFTNEDFEYYNDAAGSSTYKLPNNSSDAEAISKIRIERRTGTSSNETGLPGTYTKGIETIYPTDADIIWNSTATRWEVSFNTTGFGGYFLKSATIQDPTEAYASAATICEGGSAYLTANCATGVVFWYTQASGGDPIENLGSPVLVSPAESTIYYTSCEDGPVISNRIIADTISIVALPEIPTAGIVSKTAIVYGTSVELNATCSSGNAVWYDQLSGGKAIGIGSPLVYYPASTTTYYASCKNSVCESSGERAATNEVEVTGMDLVPYMVKDINSAGGSSPGKLFSANGKLYSGANDVVHGNELWQSGELTGTTLVKDIGAGNEGVIIENLIDVNGTTFFSVQTGTAFELWKTNGTEETTKMVKSIWGYSPTRKLANFLSFNDILYFISYDSDTFESKLWRSDGTSRRTVIAQNLNNDMAYNELPEMVEMNGALYFPAGSNGLGIELWKTDGTNTTLVKDFSENDDGRPTNLTVINNTMYFAANDGINGRELWKSDGTPEGTELVKDIFEAGESSDPIKLTNVNGTLYFVATDGINERELLKSNGSAEGTESVKYINEGEYDSSIDHLTNVNGTLYFTATTEANGNELWISDGTSGNTRLVKDINPGAEGSDISNLINLNGILYFKARNGSTNTELWKSDGTEGGTRMVKEINAGEEGSLPSDLTNVNGKMYFSSTTVFDEVNYGTELWSLGICTDDNTIVSSNGRSLNFNSQTISTITCNCDVFNNLISKVEATGDSPVSGEIQAKEWIDETASENYVKRHYEINPVADATTATGKVTLYFTEGDFNAYYATNTSRVLNLPLDHCDINGIRNVRIEKREGISSDGTGLPESYSGAITIIDPADEDIFWSDDKQRWVVSFTTTGFGGFFVKSVELKEPTEVDLSQTTICAGLSVSLEATCEGGTVTWYNQASGGTAIGTGSPVWFEPTETTTYYAACELNEFSGTRVLADTVTVKALPLSPTDVQADKESICLGGAVTLTATCPAGTVYWYTNYSGVPPLTTGNTIVVSPSSSKIYYASCRNNGCESPKVATSQIEVTAETIESPTDVAVNDSQLCNGQSVSLTANCSTGTITWYNQAMGGSTIGAGNNLSQSPTENTTYYATCKNGSCETPRIGTSEVVVVTISGPTGVTVNKTSIISGNSIVLTATCSPGSVLWYNQATGGSALAIGSSLIYSPATTTTYYAACKVDECESIRVATNQVDAPTMEQLPYMVKDIHGTVGGSSTPHNFIHINGTMYFVATDEAHGKELWKTNETGDGIVLVKDITPEGDSEIDNITNVNGTIYFSIKAENFYELWKTNGSEAGTQKLKDIWPVGDGYDVTSFRAFNGALHFIAFNNNDNVAELWKSNGTSGGTAVVRSINENHVNLNVDEAVVINDIMYFVASINSAGTELWKLIGTSLSLVKDINLSGNSDPQNLTNVNGVLYFTADDGVNGRELWKREVTGNVTVMVNDIREGSEGSEPGNLTNINGVLYFKADDGINGVELWKSNGTGVGTVLVNDIATGTDSSDPYHMTYVNGKIYFVASTTDTNSELWMTDETTHETVLVKDIKPGNTSSFPDYLTNVNGKLYFAATNGENGYELWTSDGTDDGTVMVKDTYPGVDGSNPNDLINVNGKLYYTARVIHDNINYGYELWSLGACAIANPLVSRNGRSKHFNQEAQPGSDLFTCHCDVFNNVMTTTKAVTYPETIGDLAIKEWVDDTDDITGAFVKRHYEINPASGDPLVNRRITLYFTQDDFDAYNTLQSETAFKLPADSADTEGMSHLLIEYRQGTSDNQETGFPDTYSGEPTKILPTDISAYWISSLDRWAISFATTGSGGFFLKSIELTAPTEVDVSETTICAGTTVSLTASCSFGTVTWYMVSSSFRIKGGGSTLIGTGSPLVVTPTQNITTYLASCNYDDHESGRVATADITVNAIPAFPTEVSVNDTSICSGTEVFLNATCASGTITWYDQSSGGELIATGTSSQHPEVNTTYYASCKDDNCESSRVATNEVVVTTMPSSPNVSVDFTAICSGESVTLNTSCATGTVRWYNQLSGGSVIGTSNILSRSPTVTTTYYASCKNGDCESSREASETIVVTAQPQNPSAILVNNTAICSGTSVTLSTTCAIGTVVWYNQSEVIGTGTTISHTPAETTTYYASCKNGNCETTWDSSDEVVVTTQPTIPTAVSVNNTAICSGTAVALTASCETGTITWYNQSSGGTAIGTVSPLSQSPSVTTTYYASCKNGNCESSRVATSQGQVVVTTQPGVPTSVSVSNTAICSGTAVSLTATCATGTITWYNQLTGGSAIGTVNNLSQSPSSSTTYYASCKNGNCESSRIKAGDVNVSTPTTDPTGISVSNAAICNGTVISLTATCATGIITWYNQETGGSALGTGNGLNQSPSVTTTYYASCKNGVCESNRVGAIEVVVTLTPATPYGVHTNLSVIYTGSSVMLRANCVSGTIVWYNQSTGGSAIGTGNNLSQSPAANITYYALCMNGTCMSQRVATLQLVVKAKPEQPTLTADKTAICVGDSAIITGYCASVNETFHWSTAQLRTNAQTSQSESIVRVVKEIGTYKAYCDADGVMSLESSITITQALNCNSQNFIVISPANPAVCPNTSVTLTATGCSGTITWSGGVSTRTGTSYTVNSGTASVTYLAQCSAGGSSSVTVAVPAADEIVASDVTTGAAKVKVTNSIESSRKVGDPAITPAPNVSFEAGGSILLKPGFVAEQGAVFKAEIKTCN